MTHPESQAELAVCPFCGGEAQTDFIEGESYIVECYVCRAETGIKDSAEQAIAAWNRRTPASGAASGEVRLVPVELTEAMMHAAEDVPAPRPYGAVWRAMIDAAPSSEDRDSADAARYRYIEAKHVMGASYGGMVAIQFHVNADDYRGGGVGYALDCQREAIAAMQSKEAT